MLVLHEVMWSFYVPHGKHIGAIWWHGISTNSRDSYMGTNCAPLIADIFLYCYESYFMSDLHKSKRHDLLDMFNDISRYLDDYIHHR